MKKTLFILLAILMILALAGAPMRVAKAEGSPQVTFTLLNDPGEMITLAVGQSFTFDILVTSDQPFTMAMAKANSYYPGKGVWWKANTDKASQATSALLHLTVIGKNSTAGLPQVCEWFIPEKCLAAGSAPQAVQVGARFKSAGAVGTAFPFTVVVP